MIAAARRATADPSVIDPNLDRLISEAQRLPKTDDTEVQGRSATQTVSAAGFVEGLRRSGLMPGEELSQLLQELNWDDSVDETDGSSLAKAFVVQRKLTPFQAKLLLRGRWKGLVLGNYVILERLGQGGMGSVFKARHTRMGRIVCLKVVNSSSRQAPAVIERFRNEARALAALTHPNIVVAHDADESKGVPYLVMEYIDGDDLAKTVRQNSPLPISDALEVAIQTAAALSYAHGQGVIHRDVKPHNIVATRDPGDRSLSVKVLDLGLARFDTLISDNPDASVLAAMTNTGVVIGTVDYMSPEQALDSRSADARSDIYSLGCTLFFLLTGQPPFQGDTVMKRLIAHREQPIPPLQGIPSLQGNKRSQRDLEAVMHKMLAKRPENRYQTMQDVLVDLHAVVEGRSPELATVGTHPPPPVVPSIESPVVVESDHVGSDDQPTVSLATAEPAMELEFDVPPTPVQKPRKRRRASRLAGNGATAMAFLVVVCAAVMAAPIWSWLGPRSGADLAIRNGGDGRALVIVGSENFREDEFRSLAGWLSSNEIDVVAASANYGTGKKDFGGDLKSPYDNDRLQNVIATEFDAIFVLGGTCTELTDKAPKAQREVERLVRAALDNGVVLTGCREGWNVLHETKLLHKPQYKHKPAFKVQSPEELTFKAKYIFSQLLKQQETE